MGDQVSEYQTNWQGVKMAAKAARQDIWDAIDLISADDKGTVVWSILRAAKLDIGAVLDLLEGT